MKRSSFVLVFLLFGAAHAMDQEETVERVALRVTSTGPGSAITVDRGTSDGLSVGDRVLFYPRGGGTFEGDIVEVDIRSAVVEPNDREFAPEPGTKGEALVTAGRVVPEEAPEQPEQPGEPVPPTGETTEPTPESKPEESWTPDKPLLAGLRPVQPADRGKLLSGRHYLIAGITDNPPGDFDNSFFRLGTDLTYRNPFGEGGALHFNGELGYLTKTTNDTELDLLIRRLSYRMGGTRFEEDRFEFGRFLQYNMPEFGILDGASWDRRRDNGDSFGFSAGFMPTVDEDFKTFADFQAAGYYQWSFDARDRFTARAGYQKSFHNGRSDRDLIVADARYHPEPGWDLRGTVWIDLYYGSQDQAKDSFVEVTQAWLSLLRRYDNGNGFDIAYRHWTYPDIERNGEFWPLPDNEIEGNYVHRLQSNGWWWWTPDLRANGHLSGWIDEDGSGGAAELGLDARNVLIDGSRGDIVLFATAAQFENTFGGRLLYSGVFSNGRWEFLYEASNHHLKGFPSDRNDLLQHRFRAGGTLNIADGWDFSAYGEGLYWDDQISWTLGLNFQKRF